MLRGDILRVAMLKNLWNYNFIVDMLLQIVYCIRMQYQCKKYKHEELKGISLVLSHFL